MAGLTGRRFSAVLSEQVSRRKFLALSGGIVVAFVLEGPHRAVASETAPPTGAPARDIWVTPTDRFYRRSYKSVPHVDGSAWRLTLGGLVDHPCTLSLPELQALPAVEEMRTLECIGNGPGGALIGNALWKGVRLRDLLDRAGIRPQAVRAQFMAADGYTTSVDLPWITQPGVMLAYAINNGPLPADLGYPLRVLMPGLYGQKNPKWITRIEFVDRVDLGFWEQRGWSDVAEVRTHAHILAPRGGSEATRGFEARGVTWAGKRRVTRVELGVDGAWHPAELLRGPTPLVWTQWYVTLAGLVPGTHTLSVRATDEEGYVQTAAVRGGASDVYPNGNAKIHEIVVRVP